MKLLIFTTYIIYNIYKTNLFQKVNARACVRASERTCSSEQRVKTPADAPRGLSRPRYVRRLLFLSTEYYSGIIQKIGMQVYSYGYQ